MENKVFKDNIINEMARIMFKACRRVDENGKPVGFKCMTCEWFDKDTSECKSTYKKEAIALYDDGCRFVAQNQRIVNIEEVDYMRSRFKEIAEQARKETAREILQAIGNASNNDERYKIWCELCESYGVEVEE